MRKLQILLVSLLAVFLVSGTASALPLNANGMSLPELQNYFTTVLGSSINANSEETQDEVFAFQTSGSTATYLATVSYTASNISFGLYDIDDTTNQLTLLDTALSYPSSPGDAAQIFIDLNGVTATSYYFSSPTTTTVIDSFSLASNRFGFYVTTSLYGTYFSESDRNATGTADLDGDSQNDSDHFLTYLANGDMITLPGVTNPVSDAGHWYVATEATPINGDSDDFTDLVVQFESITPVPEPATMLLLGSGLLGLALIGRKTFIKRS